MKLIKIDRSKKSDEKFNKIPSKSGVYFLWGSKSLLYIGKSIDLKRRIKQHLSFTHWKLGLVNPYEVKYVSFEILNKDRIDEAEDDLLFHLETKNNGSGNWFSRREDRRNTDWEKLREKIENVDL